MPQVLTANDYYPGGMPMPGRICSTQTTVVTAVLRDDPFNSGTASYTGTNGATLSNSSGTLLVTKLSSATDSWGARTPAHTLTAGVEYRLSYLLTLGACSAGRETRGWRVVDAAGNDIAGNIVLGTGPFNVNGTFTVPATGTYYIEFYRNTSSTGTCSFTIDNVLLISNTYLTVKVCGTPAEQYAWGHNGQYKDDEIYGPGNTYTAEYWEYDSRLMRRWNTDPVEYPWQSVYACFNNNPIFFADPLGLEGEGDGKNKDGKQENNDPLPSTQQEGTTVSATKNPNGTYNIVIQAPKPPGSKPEPVEPLPGRTPHNDRIQQGVNFIMEQNPVIQVVQGRYWDAAGTIFPAAKIAFDGYAAPARVINDIAKGKNMSAVFTYGEHVISGISLMFGIKMATPNTEAIKKLFTRAIPETGKILAGESSSIISAGDLARIENAATKINEPITVVGSRATPGRVVNDINTKSGNIADWDYVIEKLTRRGWNKIKNSLPGSKSIPDNTPRNIDIFKNAVDPTKPHITIYPRP